MVGADQVALGDLLHPCTPLFEAEDMAVNVSTRAEVTGTVVALGPGLPEICVETLPSPHTISRLFCGLQALEILLASNPGLLSTAFLPKMSP